MVMRVSRYVKDALSEKDTGVNIFTARLTAPSDLDPSSLF